MQVIQVNLQRSLGGGEIYTAFLCRALDQIGVATTLIHHADANFWHTLDLPPSVTLLPVYSWRDVSARLPAQPGWILTHGPAPEQFAGSVSAKHLLTGIAHMPPQGRSGDHYGHYHQVFGVSAYVVEGLRALGVPVWPAPLYGVADLQRGAGNTPIRQTSCYDWDRRKGRDRLLGRIEPLLEPLRQRPLFARRPGLASGLTLGIVSRLTPIKQFPQLFEIIAPIIAAHQGINLEVFGAGGYASVRDLRHAVKPLGHRVRFWGQQRNVGAIYHQLDYLLTGLPEKEALGLNVIEAQACDTPVLAVDAPPFTETVVDGQTGFLYPDPRLDHGAAFSALLDRLQALPQPLKPSAAHEHLAQFSFAALVARLKPIVEAMRDALPASVV